MDSSLSARVAHLQACATTCEARRLESLVLPRLLGGAEAGGCRLSASTPFVEHLADDGRSAVAECLQQCLREERGLKGAAVAVHGRVVRVHYDVPRRRTSAVPALARYVVLAILLRVAYRPLSAALHNLVGLAIIAAREGAVGSGAILA